MKKKLSFLFLSLVVLSLVLPIHQAQANFLSDLFTKNPLDTIAGALTGPMDSVWNGFGTVIEKLLTGLLDIYLIPVSVALQIIQMITGILPAVAGEIFRVTLNLNNEIALTPLKAGPNDIVTVGFNFTRDIANMLFLLVFAWVGFATILRLKTYEIKTIIPNLIKIALLINFIPLIAGVILDIASVITQVFADKVSSITLFMWDLLPGVAMIKEGTTSLSTLIPGNGGFSGMAVASVVGIIFNLIAAFFLLVYGLIFLIRIVVIWVLIILAPLAWFGSILPQGKKMWDKWWKQFIQWSFIGVPLTFFLYLSTFVFKSSSFVCNFNDASAFSKYGLGEGLLMGLIGNNLICNAFPFIAGIVVMMIGLLLSLTLAPAGADEIIKRAKKGGAAAGSVLGKAAAKKGWKIAKSPIESFKAGRLAWQMNRKPGLGLRPSGLKQTVGAVLERSRAAVRLEATGNIKPGAMAKSAKKGIWKEIKGSAQAGWLAGTGGKKKKKGKRTQPCDACGFGNLPGETIGAGAERCPKCGQQF